ncbi:MAG: NADP-dependent oxidoreductase [Bacteroidota bacterium]
MKAIIRTKPGKHFSTMRVLEVDAPALGVNQLKLRMSASRINPVDMDLMKGFPGLKYKSPQIGGVDGAGAVIAVGPEADGFKVGDQVFFYRKFSDIGSWAEEIVIDAADCATIPSHMSPLEAGSIALPLLTAYESILALGLQRGDCILIHGAGGGVGFQAVQLALALGADVIAHGSSRDEAFLVSTGVNRFIDYRRDDFADLLGDKPPDFILDVIGGETLLKSLRLGPKKVLSVAYMDTSQMQKTGVKLPPILALLMKLMMGKYRRAARASRVELLGQVTGADGKHLSEAAELATNYAFRVRKPKLVSIQDIEESGMNESLLGKTITF